jgi:hypothetical protein
VKTATAWLVTLFTVSFVAASVGVTAADPTIGLVTGVAVLALAAALGARYLAVRIVSPTLRVGSRSRQHRESVSRMVAPRHPNIAGRPRTRAPAWAGAPA